MRHFQTSMRISVTTRAAEYEIDRCVLKFWSHQIWTSFHLSKSFLCYNSSLLWICFVSRLVCPTLILNTILTNMFFHSTRWLEFGVVGSRTSFILSSRSWEIGSPATGDAGRMKLSWVILIWPIHTSWRRILHLSVSTVNV